MAEKTQSEITYSLLDYTSEFRRPIFGASSSLGHLVTSILDELGPSGYTLNGVEFALQTPKLDELAIVFRRTTPAIPARSFVLGLGKVNIHAENLDWTEAERFIPTQGSPFCRVRQGRS